ncbi:SDR family NAD(P)-dependent oxidoreductase, partial [Hyphomonas sp. UBA4508]
MKTNPFRLEGKSAIVTGANTGLGQGMAVALAEAGADICLVGRSAPSETLDMLAGTGCKTHSILADLGSADSVETI